MEMKIFCCLLLLVLCEAAPGKGKLPDQSNEDMGKARGCWEWLETLTERFKIMEHDGPKNSDSSESKDSDSSESQEVISILTVPPLALTQPPPALTQPPPALTQSPLPFTEAPAILTSPNVVTTTKVETTAYWQGLTTLPA